MLRPGCPGTYAIVQAGLEPRDPPASSSQILGLKAYTTMPPKLLNHIIRDSWHWLYSWPELSVSVNCVKRNWQSSGIPILHGMGGTGWAEVKRAVIVVGRHVPWSTEYPLHLIWMLLLLPLLHLHAEPLSSSSFLCVSWSQICHWCSLLLRTPLLKSCRSGYWILIAYTVC